MRWTEQVQGLRLMKFEEVPSLPTSLRHRPPLELL